MSNTTHCNVCTRDPKRMNSDIAECSHIQCPHRRSFPSSATNRDIPSYFSQEIPMFTPAEQFFTPEQLATAERLAGNLTLAPYPMPNPLAPKPAPAAARPTAPANTGMLIRARWVNTSI